MREGLVRKCRLLSVLRKSVINTSWFFRGKKKKYVPYPLFHEEERSYAICCRNFVLKGSEVWRSSNTPWRALVIWETGLIEECIPTLVVLLGPQTQMCEWTHPHYYTCSASGLLLCCSRMAPSSSKSGRLWTSESSLLSDLSTSFFFGGMWPICLKL